MSQMRVEPGHEYLVFMPGRDVVPEYLVDRVRSALEQGGARVAEIIWIYGLASIEVVEVVRVA